MIYMSWKCIESDMCACVCACVMGGGTLIECYLSGHPSVKCLIKPKMVQYKCNCSWEPCRYLCWIIRFKICSASKHILLGVTSSAFSIFYLKENQIPAKFFLNCLSSHK